jgi:DNA-binding beta-propeller fold protein YncE
LARDSTTGALSQLPGATGCVNRLGRQGCARSRGLSGAESVAVSADGRNAYVAGNGIAVFTRDAIGALHQPLGRAACVERNGRGGCSLARGHPTSTLTLSQDGRSLYTLGDGLASFARNQRTGALQQLPGRNGCVAQHTRACARARALDLTSGLSISPDGANLYVASLGSGAVAVFARHRR